MTRHEHQVLRRGIGPYLDGEADIATSASVGRHLADCWPCSEEAEWIFLIKAALRQIGAQRPTDLSVARLWRFASELAGRR